MPKIDEKISCLCAGCGGIGSYFAEHINKLLEINQLPSDWNFTFFDDDKVETKNLLYQNFKPKHVGLYKTDALLTRYTRLKFLRKRVDSSDLINFDLIILCVDNNKIRREVYSMSKPFIDSRANGRTVGIFSSATKDYLNTIDLNDESYSCQNPFQINKKEIEYGNIIIAAILSQVVLNYERKKTLPERFLYNF